VFSLSINIAGQQVAAIGSKKIAMVINYISGAITVRFAQENKAFYVENS
jgi:hypothetical protein